VGPVAVGSYKFVFQADPPDISRIPQSDILGVTVLLLTCSYDDVEFIRVGYYVNNDYHDQFEELRENPPATVQIDKVVRNILEEKPRVTRFPCEFDTPSIPTGAAWRATAAWRWARRWRTFSRGSAEADSRRRSGSIRLQPRRKGSVSTRGTGRPRFSTDNP